MTTRMRTKGGDPDPTYVLDGDVRTSSSSGADVATEDKQDDIITAINGTPVAPADIVSDYLLDGGSNAMNVDGSVSPISFIFTVPAGRSLRMVGISIYMESFAAMDSIEFGDIAALANGLKFEIDSTGVLLWKDNVDLIMDIGDLESAGEAFSKVDKSISGNFTFPEPKNAPVITATNTVAAIVQDDLSSLVILRMKVKGELM